MVRCWSIYWLSNLATKKKAVIPDGDNECDGIKLLFDHIRGQFVANAKQIAKNEKPERLLKMIQQCKELKPVETSNRELWKLVQLVRREVLGGEASPPTKKRRAAKTSRRTK